MPLHSKRDGGFVTSIHFHPSLIYKDKVRSLPLESSLVMATNTIAYFAMQQYGCKRFYSKGPRGLSHKTSGTKLLTLFCKLDHFINVTIIFLDCEKL